MSYHLKNWPIIGIEFANTPPTSVVGTATKNINDEETGTIIIPVFWENEFINDPPELYVLITNTDVPPFK